MRVEDYSGEVQKPKATISLQLKFLKQKAPIEFERITEEYLRNLQSMGFVQTERGENKKLLTKALVLQSETFTLELF